MKMFTRLATVAAVVAAFTIAPAAAASAAEPTAAPAPVSYCTQQLLEQGSAEPTPAPVCFDTQSERDAYFAQLSAPKKVSARSLSTNSTSANSVVELGTLYEDQFFGGANISMWGVGGCYGKSFQYSEMQAGWENLVSSAQGESNCWVTIFQEKNFLGNSLTCMDTCETMSTFNDTNQSVIFHPVGTYAWEL